MIDTLIIDDDAAFCQNVQRHFAQHGMAVTAITDAARARAVDYGRVKVVLLDIDMPAASGLELLAFMRSAAKPIVIMVSGSDSIAQRLGALSSGAEFFLSKPVLLEEMRLVVLQALGRSGGADAPTWTLRPAAATLEAPDGALRALTRAECAILSLLLKRAPQPATKEELIRIALKLEGDWFQHSHRLEVIISRMRARVGTDALRLPVQSVRNEGYAFAGRGTIAP